LIQTVPTYKPVVVVATAFTVESMTALPFYTVGVEEVVEEEEETKKVVTGEKGAS
jgi:hypothetical protein